MRTRRECLEEATFCYRRADLETVGVTLGVVGDRWVRAARSRDDDETDELGGES